MNEQMEQVVPGGDGEQPKRPELLKILCILTFIGSGLSMLANIIMFFTLDLWIQAYEKGLFSVLEDQIKTEVIELLIGISPLYYIIQGLLFLMSVYGAWLMWNLKRTGFHVYVVSQILLLIVSKVFIPAQPFPVIPLLLSLVFVLLYARNLQSMK